MYLSGPLWPARGSCSTEHSGRNHTAAHAPVPACPPRRRRHRMRTGGCVDGAGARRPSRSSFLAGTPRCRPTTPRTSLAALLPRSLASAMQTTIRVTKLAYGRVNSEVWSCGSVGEQWCTLMGSARGPFTYST
eukprot:234342-Pyramimonas_sp.AAC.1